MSGWSHREAGWAAYPGPRWPCGTENTQLPFPGGPGNAVITFLCGGRTWAHQNTVQKLEQQKQLLYEENQGLKYQVHLGSEIKNTPGKSYYKTKRIKSST